MTPASRHVRTSLAAILGGLALIPALAIGQTTSAPAAPPAEVPGMAADTPIGSGPYRAIMESPASLATHTLYRPADLSALGEAKLPVIVWGNGACVNAGNRFRWFLSEIASYGYVAIAVGPNGGAEMEAGPALPGAGARPAATVAPDPATLPPPATHTGQLIDAINWAIAENARPDSRLYHRLDTAHIAVMGQSCGGVQAIEASADPRVTTSVIWNSGLFSKPTTMAGGKTLTKEDLKALHGPVAYISGDPQDIAFKNAEDDFDKLPAIPAFRAYERGVPHIGTYREPHGGEFAGVAIAWLNWRLKGDATSAKMFTGEACGLCVNPRWVVRKRNMP